MAEQDSNQNFAYLNNSVLQQILAHQNNMQSHDDSEPSNSSSTFNGIKIGGRHGQVSIGGYKNFNLGSIHTGRAKHLECVKYEDSECPQDQQSVGVEVQQNILDSEKEIVTENMYLVASEIAEWKMLARHLKGANFTSGDLNNIKYDHERDGRVEIVYQILEKWKERSPENATVGNLARTLIKLGHSQIASNLEP